MREKIASMASANDDNDDDNDSDDDDDDDGDDDDDNDGADGDDDDDDDEDDDHDNDDHDDDDNDHDDGDDADDEDDDPPGDGSSCATPMDCDVAADNVAAGAPASQGDAPDGQPGDTDTVDERQAEAKVSEVVSSDLPPPNPTDRIQVKGDGSCLFRAVLACINKNMQRARRHGTNSAFHGVIVNKKKDKEETNLAQKLRASMQKPLLELTHMIPERGTIGTYSFASKKEYVHLMTTNTHIHGGELEIFALMHAIKRPIHVYRQDDGGTYQLAQTYQLPPTLTDVQSEAIELLLHNQHYDAFVR